MGGTIDQRAIRKPSSARPVNDFAVRSPAGARVRPPNGGSRLDQHRARAGSRLTHRHPEDPNRCRTAGDLKAQGCIRVERIIGWRRLHNHASEIDVEFVGQNLRHGRVDALPHFHLAHYQCDGAIAIDADEGVRCKGRNCGSGLFGGLTARHRETEQQAATRSDAHLEELAARGGRAEAIE